MLPVFSLANTFVKIWFHFALVQNGGIVRNTETELLAASSAIATGYICEVCVPVGNLDVLPEIFFSLLI